MKKISDKSRLLLIYIALVSITFIAFENVRNCGFVYDDMGYVSENYNINTG